MLRKSRTNDPSANDGVDEVETRTKDRAHAWLSFKLILLVFVVIFILRTSFGPVR